MPAGTALRLAAWEVTVGEVVFSPTGPDPAFPEMGAPNPGTVHVTAQVEAVRTGPEPGTVPAFDGGFRLGLMSGAVEVGENVALPVEGEISSGVVAPGGVVEGWMRVAANVPTAAERDAVLLVFDHGSGDVAYLAFP